MALKDYTHNSQLKEVKQQLLQGEAPWQCRHCYDEESAGIRSFRQHSITFHADQTAKILAHNDPNFFDFKNVTLLTSNRCNLKCTSCGAASYIRSIELHRLGLAQTLPVKWITKSYDLLFDYDIKHLTLLGGEPFVDRITFEIIGDLIHNGKSKNMRLDLNTNMTVMTDDQLDQLSENFAEVWIKASIDGIGEVNDYLRYPSKWSVIQENCRRALSRPNINLIVTTALSNLSLLRYYEVLAWGHELNLNLFITAVHEPSVMNPHVLPQELKVQLLQRYLSIKQDIYNDMRDRSRMSLDTCISVCQSNVKEELPDFKDSLGFFKQHDSVRPRQKLENVFPELEFYLFEGKAVVDTK